MVQGLVCMRSCCVVPKPDCIVAYLALSRPRSVLSQADTFLPWYLAIAPSLVHPYLPVRELAVGTAGPALTQRRSITITTGRMTRFLCSRRVPAWSPGDGKAQHCQDP